VGVSSRIPAIIDYLLAEFTAAATLGAATPPVTIYDGPPTTMLDAPLALHVGVDDAFSDQPPTSADSQQTGTGLAQKREELVTIHCAAVAWAGTDDMKTVRTSAFAITAAVEDLVRADASLPAGVMQRPGIAGMTLQQNNTQQGAVAQVMFQIQYKTFIGI
jgi:hypothetical protein